MSLYVKTPVSFRNSVFIEDENVYNPNRYEEFTRMKTKRGLSSFTFGILIVFLVYVVVFLWGCATKLNMAIMDGDVEKAREIIKKRDIGKLKHDRNSLILAAEEGYKEIVLELLNAGVDVNTRNKKGYTALIGAASNGHIEIVKLLTERGADVNVMTPSHVTPLIAAAENEHKRTQKLLIRKGAAVNIKNAGGWTPLMYAVLNGDKELVELLIKNGADVNAQVVGMDKKYDRYFTEDSPLHIAICNNENDEITHLLINAGASINTKNRYSHTPLYCAVDTDNVGMADFLIKNGAEQFILERNADELYVTAKVHKLIALNHEKSNDLKRAIENYSIAVEYFDRATPKLLSVSKKFRSKKFFAKLSNIFHVVGIAVDAVASIKGDVYVGTSDEIDYVNKSKINDLKNMQKEYRKKSEDSRRSAMECRNILLYLKRK